MENIANYMIAVLDLTILDLPCTAMFKQKENGDLSCAMCNRNLCSNKPTW